MSLGALVSDLVAGAFALATERESGELLRQRIAELRATCGGILEWLDRLDKEIG